MTVTFNTHLDPAGSSRMMNLNKPSGTSSPTRYRIGSQTIKALSSPFDAAAPLDVGEIDYHLQHYWQLHFKNEMRTQPSNNRNKNNKRGRDNDD